MAREDRTRRDSAGIGPDPDFSRRLYPIAELKDYRIASGEPDVRGWAVRTLNGREMGEVEDLLVDPARGEVVMLEVDLDRSGRHIAVPLRSVQVDRARECIVVDSADVDPERARVYEERFRDRMTEEDRRVLADEARDARAHDVRYEVADRGDVSRDPDDMLARRGDVEEEVVERHPVVEEVVVRRRNVDGENV